MTEFLNPKRFRLLEIGDWNLFVIWCLDFVISSGSWDSKLDALCPMLFASFAGGTYATRF